MAGKGKPAAAHSQFQELQGVQSAKMSKAAFASWPIWTVVSLASVGSDCKYSSGAVLLEDICHPPYSVGTHTPNETQQQSGKKGMVSTVHMPGNRNSNSQQNRISNAFPRLRKLRYTPSVDVFYRAMSQRTVAQSCLRVHVAGLPQLLRLLIMNGILTIFYLVPFAIIVPFIVAAKLIPRTAFGPLQELTYPAWEADEPFHGCAL